MFGLYTGGTKDLCIYFLDMLFLLKKSDLLDSVQFRFSSFAQLCPTLHDSMDHNTPGLPVYHQLPKPAQTHLHLVSDAIQPSHPLSFSSPLAVNLFQHQGLFK